MWERMDTRTRAAQPPAWLQCDPIPIPELQPLEAAALQEEGRLCIPEHDHTLSILPWGRGAADAICTHRKGGQQWASNLHSNSALSRSGSLQMCPAGGNPKTRRLQEVLNPSEVGNGRASAGILLLLLLLLLLFLPSPSP